MKRTFAAAALATMAFASSNAGASAFWQMMWMPRCAAWRKSPDATVVGYDVHEVRLLGVEHLTDSRVSLVWPNFS